jgi:hypothetical protein
MPLWQFEKLTCSERTYKFLANMVGVIFFWIIRGLVLLFLFCGRTYIFVFLCLWHFTLALFWYFYSRSDNFVDIFFKNLTSIIVFSAKNWPGIIIHNHRFDQTGNSTPFGPPSGVVRRVEIFFDPLYRGQCEKLTKYHVS